MSLNILNYHFHLYYDETTLEVAKDVAKKLHHLHGVQYHTFHEKEVGPHPMWSVQISVSIEKFADSFNWLVINHQGLTVFCHPDTGNDYLDHTEHAFWIGESKPLKIDIFKP